MICLMKLKDLYSLFFFFFFFRSKVRDTKVLIEDTDDDTWPLRPQWLEKVFLKDHRPQWALTLQKLFNQSITKLPDYTTHTYFTQDFTDSYTHMSSQQERPLLSYCTVFDSFIAALIIFVKIQKVDLQMNSKDSVYRYISSQTAWLDCSHTNQTPDWTLHRSSCDQSIGLATLFFKTVFYEEGMKTLM